MTERVKWRRAVNEWNLKGQPWRDAIGIEEDDETAVVPALICWFTRGQDDIDAIVQEVIDDHNARVEPVYETLTEYPEGDLRRQLREITAKFVADSMYADITRSYPLLDQIEKNAKEKK